MYTSGDFVIHGGDTAFANRQKLLFDKLSDAEQECSKSKMVIESTVVNVDIKEYEKAVVPRHGLKRKSETKRFRGKESIFKQPEGPAPRASRNVPDYHKNPHKWTKYSLDDVSNDDMTEQSNTQAALSFLTELKTRRSMEKSEEIMDVDESNASENNKSEAVFKFRKVKTPSNIQFKKPENEIEYTNDNRAVVVDEEDKPIFKSSKIIMPEYVVGQKQKKKSKKEKPLTKLDRSKQLKLDHLEEADEEED